MSPEMRPTIFGTSEKRVSVFHRLNGIIQSSRIRTTKLKTQGVTLWIGTYPMNNAMHLLNWAAIDKSLRQQKRSTNRRRTTRSAPWICTRMSYTLQNNSVKRTKYEGFGKDAVSNSWYIVSALLKTHRANQTEGYTTCCNIQKRSRSE